MCNKICCHITHSISLLLFILNDAFIVSDFLCSPSVSGFWWCWRKGGSGEGRQRKNINFKINFYVWANLDVFSSGSLCNMRNGFPCYSRPIYLLLMQQELLSRGRGKKLPLQKNFKSARNVFNKEEVNYDNYSDW